MDNQTPGQHNVRKPNVMSPMPGAEVQIKSPLLKKQSTVISKDKKFSLSSRKLGSMKEKNLDFLNPNKDDNKDLDDEAMSQSVSDRKSLKK